MCVCVRTCGVCVCGVCVCVCVCGVCVCVRACACVCVHVCDVGVSWCDLLSERSMMCMCIGTSTTELSLHDVASP